MPRQNEEKGCEEMKKYREFFVAEELSGKLHIFRENHQGGGLTKFVEHSAITELESQLKLASEAVELALKLEEGCGINFKKYGFKTDNDIINYFEETLKKLTGVKPE